MKYEIVSFLSEAGHSISGYEHKLLEKFAAFLSKANEPAPVVETSAPAVVIDTPVSVSPAETTVTDTPVSNNG